MNKREHLLICLAEECAEVGQSVAKALRFGLKDSPPVGGPTNEESIVQELNDILAIIELLIDDGCSFNNVGDQTAIDTKKDKVMRFMEYAKERGTLEIQK